MVVTAAYLASRLLGWVRLIVITNTFGASADLDAYFAAFRLPDTIFQLVAAGALGSALIPVLAGLFTHNEEDRAWRVVSSVLNFMLLAARCVLDHRGDLGAGRSCRSSRPASTWSTPS